MIKLIPKNKIFRRILWVILGLLSLLTIWQIFKQPSLTGDWQVQLAIPSTAEFNGDLVTVRNVRNFRYGNKEEDTYPGYYDRTYNLNEIKKVWYTAEPFNENKVAAHTFLSFEFNNGDFLAITIEARKTKDQVYSIYKGMARTYPLIYIAADERDITLLRANLRKDSVYIYPVKLSKPENGRLLLTDMLERMNDLLAHPKWYNTFWANCTSSIVYHVNKLAPKKISMLSWQLWLTASADELALKHGLLDTNPPIDQAREKYFITKRSITTGDVADYSRLIRQFDSK